MSRPCHCRRLENRPQSLCFRPDIQSADEAVVIGHDCLEALRLADLLGLGNSEAAEKMGISRHTFGRLLRKARHGVANAICRRLPLLIDGGETVCLLSKTSGENIMSEAVLVAVPSENPGGLEAAPSAHFGHCAFYTVAKIMDGKIGDVQVVPNQGHEHGGCVQPVKELARQGVRVLLAGGMGMKPLNAMQEAGIEVYYCVNQPTVKDALTAFSQGKLKSFGTEQLCTGCHGHH